MDYVRIFLFVVLVGSIFFVPWWLVYLAAVMYMVYYSPTFEIVCVGMIADGVYGVLYTHTLVASLLCIIVYTLRSYIRV